MYVLSRFLKDTANCSELALAIKWVLETVGQEQAGVGVKATVLPPTQPHHPRTHL